MVCIPSGPISRREAVTMIGAVMGWESAPTSRAVRRTFLPVTIWAETASQREPVWPAVICVVKIVATTAITAIVMPPAIAASDGSLIWNSFLRPFSKDRDARDHCGVARDQAAGARQRISGSI